MNNPPGKFYKIISLLLFGYAVLSLTACVPMKAVSWSAVGGRRISKLSFSPDGKHIVYLARSVPVQKSDIFERKLDIFINLPDGTGEQNLTQHPDDYWHPVWSPDGQFIYFILQRGLYRIRNDGTELRIISKDLASAYESNFNLSPDGKEIVFAQEIPGTPPKKEKVLVIASADGSNQRVLVKGGLRPQWSPDGQWILHQRDGDAGGAWILHPDSSGERRIELDNHFGSPFVWTPDSQAIFAYVRGAHCNDVLSQRNLCPLDVYLINLNGTGRQLVLQDLDNSFVSVTTISLNFPRSWDSSGTRLVLAVNTKTQSNGILILDRYGGLLADFRPKCCSTHHFLDACWSPDGKTIWFKMTPGVPGETTGGIFSIKGDGTGEKQVIPDNIVWSRD